MLSRRAFLSSAGATAFGLAFWRQALAVAATTPTVTAGPYGPLRAPDANGLALPEGFRSRVVARSGAPVPGTGYVFPIFPDGATTFALPDGGWVLVVNSEVPGGAGGVSAIRFAADGTITGAERVLGGTSTNCAGGPTPWGTWLSCEEVDDGRVWECDPTGTRPAVVRPALGVFKHEAACVDPVGEHVFLTEDVRDGLLYRFTPDAWPSLDTGRLEAAVVSPQGRVTWARVPDPSATTAPTREQVPGAARFARAEGIWLDDGVVYVATTGDDTIHALELATQRLTRVYRRADVPGSPLQGVDNIVVSRSGDLFVCEDAYANDPDALDVCMVTREGEVARFLKATGPQHRVPGEAESELTGVTFDPSGRRMYVGSQRSAPGGGVVYEITGPFRLDRPAGARPGALPRPAAADGAAGDRERAGGALGLATARRARVATVLDRGLGVKLTLDGPAVVTATLRARATVGGRRRTVVLARGRRRLGGGPRALRLRVRDRGTRRLLRRRRHALRAQLEVRVGGRRAVRRDVVLVPARR